MTPLPKPAPPHIAIVGGGLAGLATASALADRGLQITILESRPRLGGRASSFNDPATGELVDNCQHVSMACCTNLADFCRRVGIDSMLRREHELVFLGPDGRVSRFRPGWGRPRFTWPAASWRPSFSVGAISYEWLLVWRAWHRCRDGRTDEPFAEWLLRHRQSLRAINLFWAPVLVSALNERLEQMDFGHAARSFSTVSCAIGPGFSPRFPLCRLESSTAHGWRRWLRDHDVAVRLTTGVEGGRARRRWSGARGDFAIR